MTLCWKCSHGEIGTEAFLILWKESLCDFYPEKTIGGMLFCPLEVLVKEYGRRL